LIGQCECSYNVELIGTLMAAENVGSFTLLLSLPFLF